MYPCFSFYKCLCIAIVDCWLCREIEDTILLALHSPEVYDDIARGTRRKFESNKPRAVLFDGPPGIPFNLTTS
jgi:hypothetical protein